MLRWSTSRSRYHHKPTYRESSPLTVYVCRYDAVPDDLNEIARINHQHSENNPYSQFRTVYSLDEIKNSQSLYGPVTKLQWCGSFGKPFPS